MPKLSLHRSGERKWRAIRYRVVDEYGGDTLSGRARRTSVKPLTLGGLAEFFLRTWNPEPVLAVNFWLADSSLDEALDFMRGESASRLAVVTAFNPFSTLLSQVENEAHQVDLIAAVEAAGLAWFPAAGVDPTGEWEPELLVHSGQVWFLSMLPPPAASQHARTKQARRPFRGGKELGHNSPCFNRP